MPENKTMSAESAATPLPESATEWLANLDRLPNTKKTYEASMRRYLAWVNDTHRSFEDLTEDDVAAYKQHLLDEGKAAKTVNLYLAAVKSYYKARARKGEGNIAQNVEIESVARVPKREFLTLEEIYDLLYSIDRKTEKGARDYAILNLMIRTGIREKEVAEADIRDIDERGEQVRLWVRGKGHREKDDFVVLMKGAYSPIEAYLDEWRVRGDGTTPLFTSTSNRNRDGRLKPAAISEMVKERLRFIGFDDERYTAHSLRHTAITLALAGGATTKQVQEMARHADAAMTAMYVHDYERRQNPAEGFIERLMEE